MKLGIAVVAIVMVSSAAVAGAQGKKPMHPPAMSKSEWQKMYNKAELAFDKMDSKALFSYMAPDFTITMSGKTMTKAEGEASLKSWFSMMKNLHCNMTVIKVSGDMNNATVVDRFVNSGMTKPDPKTHKSGKLVDSGTETATWVRKDGRWWMKSLVNNNDKMTMNGKPFNPKMGG